MKTTFALLLFLSLPPVSASAQDLYRWEVAPLVGQEGGGDNFDYGGRVTFNFKEWIAGEIQMTRADYDTFPAEGREIAGFARTKLTYRFNTPYKLSVFAI